MHWLITFAAFCAFNNKPVSSWEEAAPRGQVSCDSSLQCLLLSPPKLDASKKTPAPRDTNTWYPIPKWKVIFQANKNRHEYSEPYFNKQDPTRTDGNIRDNDFSSPLPDRGKRGGEVFERLNIQFLPLLGDGNATTARGGVSDGGSEYVALFVIYAHSARIDIRKVKNDSDEGTLSVDLEMKSMNGSGNASESCEGIDNCLKHARRMFLPPVANAKNNNNTLFTNRSNVIMIPIAKNMMIEMKSGELNNNFTAFIIPFKNVTNGTKDGNEFKLAMDSEALQIPISKNRSILVKTDDIFHCNKSLNGNNCFTLNNGLNSSLTHNAEQLENNTTQEESDAGYHQMDDQNNHSDPKERNTNNFIRDFTLGKYPDSSENGTSFYDNIYTSTDSSFNSTTSNFIFDETSVSGIVGHRQTDEDKPFNLHSVPQNTSINDRNDLYNASTPLTEGSFLLVNRLNYTKNNTSKRPSFTIREEIYKKTLGPYEVKEIRGEDFPFIATIELIINNRERGSQETDKKIIQLKNFDQSYPRNDSASNSNIATILQRQKRNKINETLGIQHKTNWSWNDTKTKTTDDGYFSHKTEDSYKYPKRVILNKAEDSKSAAGAMNHDSLILPKELGEEQNNSSRLFLFSGGTGSYSYTTISSGNEEFNQNRAGEFGNKGLISNEISDKPAGVDGVKSNQTTQGFRNKRELALPTLIPNKDSRENRSVPKKSELQIAAEGSLDEDSSDWKMKIPPGVEHLRRDGIKTGKICDLKDGCKGINDVFNSMTKSEYYEEDGVRKESFEAIESFDVMGERTDDKMKFPNYHFMRKMSDKAIDIKVSNDRESGFFEDKDESNLSQKNPPSDGSSYLNIQRHVLPIKAISKQFRIDQKGEMNLYHGIIKPHVEMGNSSSNEINFKTMERNETQIFRSLPKIIAQKSPQVAKNLLRRKRSQSGPVPNFYPGNSFYLMNLNNLHQPQVQPFRRNANPHLNNASSPTFRMLSSNERQDTDAEWKDYMLYLPIKTPTNDGDTLRSSTAFQTQPESKIKEWWFKRGSAKRQRGWQNRWRPSDEEVNPSSVRNIDQGYRLVLLIPETAEQQRPRLNPPVSTRKPVYNEQPRQIQGSSDREREGDNWLRNQWILVNTENDGGNRNNVRTPSRESPSFDIINMPRAVTNLQTTSKPTVQGVSSTTPKPGGSSTPSTTTKASGTIPTTTPNPKTTSKPWPMPRNNPWSMSRSNPWSMPRYKPWPMPTSKPWSFDDPWDVRWSSNYWTVSQNPWKNYPTRPPMMMGGMAGGD